MIRRALTFGLLAAVGVAAWTMIEFTLGWHDERSDFGRYTGFIGLLAPIAAITLAIRAARRAREGRLGFAEGMSQGSAVTVVYALLAAVFYYAYYVYINPGYNDAGTPVDPVHTARSTLLHSVVSGLLISAVAAFALRSRDRQGVAAA
jgi:hypothetical protein